MSSVHYPLRASLSGIVFRGPVLGPVARNEPPASDALNDRTPGFVHHQQTVYFLIVTYTICIAACDDTIKFTILSSCSPRRSSSWRSTRGRRWRSAGSCSSQWDRAERSCDGAHADAGLQPAPKRHRMGRGARRGPGAGGAGLSPAGAAPLPHGDHDSLPGRGEGSTNAPGADGRTILGRKGEGPGLAAAAGGPGTPPAPLSALRGVVLAGAEARVLRPLLPVGHRAQQGPPGEGQGGGGQESCVALFTRPGPSWSRD